jgi:hypothetical protein
MLHLLKILFAMMVIVGNFLPIVTVFANTTGFAQFTDIDLDNNSVLDRVNFGPFTSSTAQVVVDDSSVAGYAWGESVGWINFNPSNGGVANTCDGNVSGYAWGENTGWINFGPFVNSSSTSTVKIDTNTGQFGGTNGTAGYAWAQNYGWLKFDCSDSNSCVTTTWDGCVVDVCPNIPGNQTSVPTGYELIGGQCVIKECTDCGTGSIPAQCTLNGNTPIVYPGDSVTLTWNTNIADGQYTGGIVGGSIINANNVNSIVRNPTATITYNASFTGNFTTGVAFCSTTIEYDHCPNLPGLQLFGQSCEEGDLNYCSNDPNITTNAWLAANVNNQVRPGNNCITITDDFCPGRPGTTFANWLAQSVNNDITQDGICIEKDDPSNNCPNRSGITRLQWMQENPLLHYITESGDCEIRNPDRVCYNLSEEGFENIPQGFIGVDEGNQTCLPVDPEIDPPVLSIGKMNIAWLPQALAVIGLLATIPGFATRLVNLILALPFYRRKRPWGVVYDSVTKETLDPAYVSVFNADTHELVDTRITDIHGRYGFLLPKGNYYIKAQKTNYEFPTKKIPQKNSDGVYDNLYFGEVFSVTDDSKSAVITLNIPMDRLAVDWNQEEKKRLGLVRSITKNTKLWSTVSLVLFILGFLFSAFVLTLDQSTWNVVVFILYVVFALLQITGYGAVHSGIVKNKQGNPIAHAVVRVWNAHLGTEIAKRVTDKNGQYYLLVAKGDYYVTIDMPTENQEVQYERVFTSGTIRAVHGIINEDFVLE